MEVDIFQKAPIIFKTQNINFVGYVFAGLAMAGLLVGASPEKCLPTVSPLVGPEENGPREIS